MTNSNLVDCYNRQVGRLLALENAAGVDAEPGDSVREIGSVAHQAASRRELAILVDRRHRVADGERGKLFALAVEEWIAADHEPAGPQSAKRCKDCIEIALRCSRAATWSCSPSVRAAACRSLDMVSA